MASPGVKDDQNLPGKFVHKNPVEDFAQLENHVREWLEEASPEKLALLDEFLVSYDRAKFLGRFFRRIGLAIIGGLGTAVLFGEQVAKAWHWLVGR